MKKNKIYIIILVILLLISFFVNIILGSYLFCNGYEISDTKFNNYVTPIAAIIATIIAFFAWKENNKNNKLNTSQFRITEINERLSRYLNKLDDLKILNRFAIFNNNSDDLVLYKDYYNKVIKPTFTHYISVEFSNNTNNTSYYDYIKDNGFIIENIDFFYNNPRIFEILENIENLNIEAKTLEDEHYKIYCKRLEMEINSYFSNFKVSNSGKKFPYKNNENFVEFKYLKDFNIPQKIESILKQIN